MTVDVTTEPTGKAAVVAQVVDEAIAGGAWVRVNGVDVHPAGVRPAWHDLDGLPRDKSGGYILGTTGTLWENIRRPLLVIPAVLAWTYAWLQFWFPWGALVALGSTYVAYCAVTWGDIVVDQARRHGDGRLWARVVASELAGRRAR